MVVEWSSSFARLGVVSCSEEDRTFSYASQMVVLDIYEGMITEPYTEWDVGQCHIKQCGRNNEFHVSLFRTSLRGPSIGLHVQESCAVR
jgi:hypothetical protein